MAVERIRIRRDVASVWTSANPILASAEMGIETDTGRIKVGDGSTAWISLEYAYAKADRVASKTGDYTIGGIDDDNVYNVTTGASDITITLPAGSGMTAGDIIEVHKVDSGTGKVVVSRAGSDTIEGATTVDLPSQYNFIRLRWSGATWSVAARDDDDTDWTSETSGFTNGWTGAVVYKKRSGWVTVTVSLDGTSNTNTIALTLPARYRPSEIVYGSAIGLAGTDVPLSLFVDTLGRVTVDGNGNTNSVIRGQVTYPVG